MTTPMTSLVRSMCDPGAVCRTVTASVVGTRNLVTESVNATLKKTKEVVSRTQAVAVGTVRFASRPLLWPVHLYLDLSRRVTIQVLITLKEVLVTLNDLVNQLEEQLAKEGRTEFKAIEYKTSYLPLEDRVDDGPTISEDEIQEEYATLGEESDLGRENDLWEDLDLPGSRDHALEIWKRHMATTRKLKETNAALKHRLLVTENKYEVMNSQIVALKDLYRDKLADMEFDLNDLKRQRHNVMSMIQSAQTLANDCHGDVQQLMDELHDLTEAHRDDCSVADSLSLDLSPEGFTLTSQQREWQLLHDNDTVDTGYFEDFDSDSNSLRLRRVLHHQLKLDQSSPTSSVASSLDSEKYKNITKV